ncbi:MAG: hypothetical protein H8F28_16840 [Fibrella sp.]|nr:hypothetical protein [Armatimonadota bacterium]
MYQKNFRTKSVRYAALTAALLPALLSGTAYAVQQPEDELIPFAQPAPFMPFYHGEPEDGDVLFSLDGYDGFSSSSTVEALDDEARHLDERIKEAKESVNKARSRGDQAELRTAESRVTSLEKSRTALRKTIERARRLAPLQKKVDVKFENATVAQAAEALSRASGVQIKVDDTIPDTTRLTVEARKVRLVTVLESVARQAGLTIEPINLEKGDIGTELIAPPMLRVNNTVQKFATSPSPWSDKWGTPPTSRYIFTSGLPRVWNYSNGDGRTITRAYVDGISAEAMGKSMAALGELAARKGLEVARVAGHARTTVFTDEKGTTIEVSKPGTVTIVEAAKNDKNEDGHWRTVYTLKNGELVQQSRMWEKAKGKKAQESGWFFKTSSAIHSRV